MAITFTLDGLQTELQAAATAVDASDFVAARAAVLRAGLVLAGLPVEVKARTEVVRYREDLSRIEQQISAVQSSSAATDNRRFIRFGLANRG